MVLVPTLQPHLYGNGDRMTSSNHRIPPFAAPGRTDRSGDRWRPGAGVSRKLRDRRRDGLSGLGNDGIHETGPAQALTGSGVQVYGPELNGSGKRWPEEGAVMRTLLGAVLVLVAGAAGCQPSRLDQCREAVASHVSYEVYVGQYSETRGCGENFWDTPGAPANVDHLQFEESLMLAAGFSPEEVLDHQVEIAENSRCKRMVLTCLTGWEVSDHYEPE